MMRCVWSVYAMERGWWKDDCYGIPLSTLNMARLSPVGPSQKLSRPIDPEWPEAYIGSIFSPTIDFTCKWNESCDLGKESSSSVPRHHRLADLRRAKSYELSFHAHVRPCACLNRCCLLPTRG